MPRAVLTAARTAQAQRLGELCSWLAIPSVSADPARADDVARAARWLVSWQRAHGAKVEVRRTAYGSAVVLGHWAGPPGAPLVVIYGHYDVQPPGPGWSSPPFRPLVRAGRIVARGAGDDKGQLFAHLCALAAWHGAGTLPVSVLCVADGAEEVGSPGFDTVARRLARRLRPTAVVISDTERSGDGTPTVTLSQRGHVVADLEVDTGGPEVHPGRLGGAVVDAGLVLAEILLALRAELLEMLEDETRDPSGVQVEVRSDGEVVRAAGGRSTTGPDLDERITRRANLGVTRLSGEGGGGALPAVSAARVDVRLPPRASPAAVVERSRRLVERLAPSGTTVRLRVMAATRGLETMPGPPIRRAVESACEAGFGRGPVYVRSGGTIPAAGMLARAFGVDPVLLGFGAPGGNAHGPDESMDVAGWVAGVETSLALLPRLAVPNRGHGVAVDGRRHQTETIWSVHRARPRRSLPGRGDDREQRWSVG